MEDLEHLSWIRARTLAIVLAAAAASCSHSTPSNENTATTPATPPTVAAVIPTGWMIEQRHDADFDGEGHADALLLLRSTDGGDDTPRRMLLVALATTPSGYKADATNAELVPRDPSGALEDPLANGGISLAPGGFQLTLGLLAGAGSYQAATIRYDFQYEPGCFRLVRYLRAETNRATLATRDTSVDFLSGGVTDTTGDEDSGAKTTRRSQRQPNARVCLPDLPSGWTFDPLKQ